MKDKKPICRLDQFNDKGRKVTYMTMFMGKDETVFPTSYAIFKVYDKKERTFFERVFDFGRYKKRVGRTLIASQIHYFHNS